MLTRNPIDRVVNFTGICQNNTRLVTKLSRLKVNFSTDQRVDCVMNFFTHEPELFWLVKTSNLSKDDKFNMIQMEGFLFLRAERLREKRKLSRQQFSFFRNYFNFFLSGKKTKISHFGYVWFEIYGLVSYWLYGFMVFNAVFSSISVIFRRPVHLSMLSGVLLTSTLHNILSKPLAAFPLNHCRNNGQRWVRNESCSNDAHQSSERILAEQEIEPTTSCSQVLYTTDWAMGLGQNGFNMDDTDWLGKKLSSFKQKVHLSCQLSKSGIHESGLKKYRFRPACSVRAGWPDQDVLRVGKFMSVNGQFYPRVLPVVRQNEFYELFIIIKCLVF